MNKQLERAAKMIADAVHPVSFSGAGLSAESGIATFRDRGDEDALWSKFDPQKLASQEGFLADPEMVTAWYNWRRKTLSEVQPNSAHLALAKLHGWTHITQNVDDLLERSMDLSGVDVSPILHLHGTLLEDHCNANCGHTELIDLSCAPALRNCDCGSYMRPSVVWFGESLPAQVLQTALQKTEAADLMLVVGTSAQVYPAAGLMDIAVEKGAEVIVVNKEPSGVNGAHVLELIGPAGELLPQLMDRLACYMPE